MNKTLQALDELISSIITLVPTWLSMLKSTRVLTIIGTGAIMYFTATQGGLTESQAMVAQAAEALLGVSFIGFKTIRSTGTATPTPTYTPTASQPASTAPAEPEEVIQYDEPFNIKNYDVSDNAYLSWENLEDLYSMMDLRRFHPAVRIEFAIDTLNEGLFRLKAAFIDLMKGKAAEPVDPPTAADFDQYDGTEEYKLKVMKAIPGCQYLPENIKNVIIGFGRTYEAKANAEKLLGKPINWTKISTIEDIRRVGLGAVS